MLRSRQVELGLAAPFMDYNSLATFARASSASRSKGAQLHQVVVHPVNQHTLAPGQSAGSCTVVALTGIACFWKFPQTTWANLLDPKMALVGAICQKGTRLMERFTERVLRPIAGAAVLPALSRPDEILANLEILGPLSAPLADVFQAEGVVELSAGAILEDILCDVQRDINGYTSKTQGERKLPHEQLPSYVLCIDAKSFLLLTEGRCDGCWLLYDSHHRGSSGIQHGTSLVATGRLDADLVVTLGNVLTRGGDNAAFKKNSTGCAWSFQSKIDGCSSARGAQDLAQSGSKSGSGSGSGSGRGSASGSGSSHCCTELAAADEPQRPRFRRLSGKQTAPHYEPPSEVVGGPGGGVVVVAEVAILCSICASNWTSKRRSDGSAYWWSHPKEKTQICHKCWQRAAAAGRRLQGLTR